MRQKNLKMAIMLQRLVLMEYKLKVNNNYKFTIFIIIEMFVKIAV